MTKAGVAKSYIELVMNSIGAGTDVQHCIRILIFV